MGSYTDEERANAVALYVDHGLAEAHRRTGISKTSLQRWATDAGHDLTQLAGRTHEKTVAATQARTADLEQQRLDLAAGLMADARRLRGQLFAPCVERKAMVVSLGKEQGSEVEVVDIERTQPTFGDQQRIMTTVAIAVDKVQILTGEATERVEHRQVPERTPEQEAEMAKVVSLADRRAA